MKSDKKYKKFKSLKILNFVQNNQIIKFLELYNARQCPKSIFSMKNQLNEKEI